MADFGEFGGPIKDYLGSQSITAETGGTDTTITHEITSVKACHPQIDSITKNKT